jgi:rubrerythrin
MSGTARTGGTTRSELLVRGALATAAAWGAGAAGSWTAQVLAKAGDVGVLDFAVRLEYVQTAFYRRAHRVALTPDAARLAAQIAGHEQEHTDALLSLLTKLGPAPREPASRLPLVDQAGFLELAQTLEETTVSVYNAVTPLLVSRDLVAAFASIVQVEARHAAAVRHALARQVSPEAFDKPTSRSAALDALTPLVGA